MKCDKCKTNEATFHSVTNINGKVSEKHLCEKCAKGEKEFSSFNENFFNFNSHQSFFDDMMSDFKTTLSYFTSPRLAKFLDDDFFDDGIRLIEGEDFTSSKQSENVEKEESKKKLSNEEKQQIELNKLNIQLKKAVVEERYEDAIKLRDKIKEMTKQKSGK